MLLPIPNRPVSEIHPALYATTDSTQREPSRIPIPETQQRDTKDKNDVKDEYGIEPAAVGAVVAAMPAGGGGEAAEEAKSEFKSVTALP